MQRQVKGTAPSAKQKVKLMSNISKIAVLALDKTKLDLMEGSVLGKLASVSNGKESSAQLIEFLSERYDPVLGIEDKGISYKEYTNQCSSLSTEFPQYLWDLKHEFDKDDKKGKRIAKEGDKKEKMNASTIKTILKQMSVEDPVSNKLFKELMIYFLIEEVLLCGPNAKIVRKATCRLRDFDGCNTVNWAQAIKDHMDYSFERAKEWVEAGRVGQHSFSGAAPVLEAILFERIPDVRPDIFSAGILPIEMYEAQRTNLSNSFENLASIQACLYCPSAENTPSLQNTPSLENSHAAAAATNLENSPAAAATNLENSLLAEQFSELSVSLVGDAAGSSEAAIQTDLSLSSRNVASTTEDLDKDEDVGGDADVFEDQKYTDVGADAYVGQVQEFANVGADSAVAVKAGTVRADAYVCEIQEDSDVSADEAVPIKSRTVDVTVGDAAVGEAQPAQPLRRSTRQSRRTKRVQMSKADEEEILRQASEAIKARKGNTSKLTQKGGQEEFIKLQEQELKAIEDARLQKLEAKEALRKKQYDLYEVNIADCKFYAFEEELKQCPCERGFFRTVFRKGIKYWCCCVRGGGACGMV
nr:protein root hair defective 3 [Tanacetum cinerariifolium]